jgi:release factor glutamine methyltransferase
MVALIKGRASYAIGIDSNLYALECARDNLKKHHLEEQTLLVQADNLEAIPQDFSQKFDLIISGLPWDELSQEEFDVSIPNDWKSIAGSFYDINNRCIKEIMIKSFPLLKLGGRVFITACLDNMERMENLCKRYNIRFDICHSRDLHQNCNTHYVLELLQL